MFDNVVSALIYPIDAESKCQKTEKINGAYFQHIHIVHTLPKDAECSFLTKRVTFNTVDVLFFSKIA